MTTEQTTRQANRKVVEMLDGSQRATLRALIHLDAGWRQLEELRKSEDAMNDAQDGILAAMVKIRDIHEEINRRLTAKQDGDER